MAGNRKVVSFFLASPGDLIAERKIAKRVAEELNSMLSLKFNIHIELVGWEDTVSSAGRPQEIINRDLERCDVFIGLVWKRWGSAPDNESKYQSGFEEEFTIATFGNKQKRKPLISLFFKKIDTPALNDPGEQLQKVINFRKKVTEDKTLLFQVFETEDEFEGVIRKCISSYALEHIELNDAHPQATHTPEAEIEKIKDEEDKSTFDFSPIQGQSANFIQAILRRTGDASNRAKLEPFEVARLRLISNRLGDSQNDSAYLGTHDANLIYKNKEKCVLESQELLGLLHSGAKNLQYESVPIWYWLQHPENRLYNLNFLSLTIPDNDYAIINSILDLLTLTGTEIQKDDYFDRGDYIKFWLSEKKNFSVRNAALRYLCEKGVEGDLIEIHKEINKNSSQTIALAYEAYIAIKLRSGVGAALTAVNDLQPVTLGKELVDRIFENHSHITTEELHKSIENRNKIVRCKAIEVLLLRNGLSSHQIELIQQDPEPSVRALAIPALLKQGANLSEDEAKAIIMKDKTKPTAEEDLAWSKFQPKILSLLDRAELERRSLRHLPIIPDAYIELSRRNINAQRPVLTRDLLDKYENFYDRHLRLWAESTNDDPDAVLKQFDTLKSHIINKFMRKTLTILVEKKSQKDLLIVRSTLADPLISPIEADLEYLHLFGEWQDIPLVIDLLERFKPAEGKTLLGGSGVSKEVKVLAVRTILKLGKDRLADVLILECKSEIKRYIISSIKDKEFSAIGEDVIIGILQDVDSEIRKHCSLKCAKTYSRTRLSALLEKYNKADQSFYNVIHWLDFGLYSSKDQIRNVCRKTFIL